MTTETEVLGRLHAAFEQLPEADLAYLRDRRRLLQQVFESVLGEFEHRTALQKELSDTKTELVAARAALQKAENELKEVRRAKHVSQWESDRLSTERLKEIETRRQAIESLEQTAVAVEAALSHNRIPVPA